MKHDLSPPSPAGQGSPSAGTRGRRTAARRRAGPAALVGLLAGFGGVAAPAAAGPGVSAWVRSGHSEARLLALGPGSPGAARIAAVQIRLDPGYLTYWRQPGEGGLPPTIDTSASQGIGPVAVDFPAPTLLDEGGAQLFGYRTAVTFPLRLAPAGPGPAQLAVTLDYAVCAAICLPGRAAMALPLPDATDPEAASIIAAAQAAVPRPVALAAAGSPALTAAKLVAGPPPGHLEVVARAVEPATLFVEGPDGWFFAAAAGQAAAGGTQVFAVPVLQSPAGATGAVALRFTLTEASQAIETSVDVDAGPATP